MYKPEKPYSDYAILDLSRPKPRQQLIDMVCAEEHVSVGGTPYAALDTLFKHAGLRSAIVESEYVDVDHSHSYARFYARSFQDHQKRATRVHFFSCKLTRPDLARLGTFKDDYLGYMVVRPLRIRRIGRTALRPPNSATSHFHFPTIAHAATANIAGFSLTVPAVPFVEQDARVSACASAAIWMATAPTVRRFSLQPRTTAEITEFATEIDIGSRLVQSEGLTPDQMLRALRHMGYEPMKIGFKDQFDAMSTIYPYVESGVAPVLLLRLLNGFHTVACTGHTYDPARSVADPVDYQWTGTAPIKVWRSWQWVPEFIVHDDQRGPYRLLRFLSTTELLGYLSGLGVDPAKLSPAEWRCPVLIEHDYSQSPAGHPADFPKFTIAGLLGAVVPTPAGVSLSAAEAEEKVARVIQVWAQAMNTALPDYLHLRTYLASSNEFKARVVGATEMHPFAQRTYLGKGLPHWLWVTEVALRDEVVTSDPLDARIRGEILVDANSSPWLPDFVALHLPRFSGGAPTKAGYITMMSHADKDVAKALDRKSWALGGEVPYPRFTREWS
ncbi:MAG: hypothetical protein WD904_03440 [Dehalococcoidia bacterium]